MKTIGILTSGGDAPGMNSAIRAIVRTAIFNGIRVMGIKYGYDGLIGGDIYEMNVSSVADIIQRGGTILGSARSEEFKTEEGQKKAVRILTDYGIDGLVVLGGDGSFRGANVLSQKGIKTVGIPCTIDNDMGFTDYTIGFFSSVETVVDAISKLRDTSSSHGRANVVEVMGRSCGDIALYSGVAGGAETIIIPENIADIEVVTNKVIRGKKRGKRHHIIVLAEGVGNAYVLAEEVEKKTGVETKVTILGHIQRGGNPAAFDRLLGSRMGYAAVSLMLEGKTDIALAVRANQITHVPILEAVETKHEINRDLYDLAKVLSI